MTIEQVAKIIKQVSDTSSKKEKEDILASNVENTLLGKVLNHIFNPYVKTNIAKKKLAKVVKAEKEFVAIETIYEFMDYLQQSTGKDSQIATVQSYISSQPEDLWWFLEAIATKDLKIGATSSTINKAYGFDFIPTFDVMLADKWVEVKKSKGVEKTFEHWRTMIGKRVIATPKLDGIRAVVFVREDGAVNMYSREGHEFLEVVDLEKAFSDFPKGNVYDGEFLAHNEEGLNSQELFKKTSKIIKKKGIKKGLEFHAFDFLPIAEFEKGGWEMPTERRKEMVARVIDLMDNPLIKYVEPLYIGEFNKELLDGFADDAKKNEEEGIMVQLADVPYECKRTRAILKVKAFHSADILCLDVYEGKSGENIGRLGGLVLDFKGHRVNVGGGFSSELRDSIWENKDLVLGKIIEIKYFEEFYDDEKDKIDLRFATFKTIREDKSEPSYF